MLLWEEQMSVWHIIEVVSAETHLHGDNLGILTREDRLETQPRGKMRSERKLVCEGKPCIYQFLVVHLILSALSVLCLHPQLRNSFH